MIFLLFALGLREISAQDETFFSSGLHVLKRWHFKRLLLSPGTNRYGIWGLKQKLCFLSTMQVKWWYFKKCPKRWAEHSDSADWGMQHTSRDTWWDKKRFLWIMFVHFCLYVQGLWSPQGWLFWVISDISIFHGCLNLKNQPVDFFILFFFFIYPLYVRLYQILFTGAEMFQIWEIKVWNEHTISGNGTSLRSCSPRYPHQVQKNDYYY